MVGCAVETLEGKLIGTVISIWETGANSIFVVKQGEKEVLIPSVPHVLKEVNVEQKRIRIDPFPGLLDD